VTGDPVLRLLCRHVFHIECWHDFLVSEEFPDCPNCRGAGRVIARWRFIAPPVVVYDPTAPQHAPSAAAPAVSRQSSYQSATSQFVAPWWPSGLNHLYLSATQLNTGEISVLVDPGAWTNLIGGRLARQLLQKAVNAGFKPDQWKLKEPLHVAGVGNGTQKAEWCVKFPIAIEDRERTTATSYFYEAPVVDGDGDHIPGLLGLRSMRARKGVLEMTEGSEVLSFPGPGGYTINWSPGTIHVPLRTAPSGHLVFVVDAFGKVKRHSGGLPEPSMTLHTHATPFVDFPYLESNNDQQQQQQQQQQPAVDSTLVPRGSQQQQQQQQQQSQSAASSSSSR